MSQTPSAGTFLVLGEVHTALLQSSAALPVNACERLVRLVGGERVRRYERPIAHVCSPSVLTGVDCRLATPDGARVRAIGTVASRVAITGGHLLQASSRVGLEPSADRRRLPWSQYLARPGRAEVIAKRLDAAGLARGFIDAEPDETVLDLASVSTRLVDEVQKSPALDRRAPLRAGRTKLRWAALVTEGEPAGPSLTVASGGARTLVVQCRAVDVDTISDFCDDVALHDWLLTTLLHVIESSRMGNDDHVKVMARLRPAVEHLLHLWMPEARLAKGEGAGEAAAQLWRSLEDRPGMSRQWRSCVDRIRDQLALNTIALFGARLGEGSR
ncbi:SCO2521 family protein [Dactylosporangium sp. AC04546]|uniref:SCO2521 family protein n=1 Tax=Dactylosporangium sp. AC04546 TaxID=2862460 RepID=UPI001EDF3A8D|nr:SCO2521 family protein [Dactylosporangium sp. AC04546]WVK84024.1 SCO2521 family protein [Dactylosporangium sp. AC04546]